MFRLSRNQAQVDVDKIKISLDLFPYEVNWDPYLISEVIPVMIPWLNSEIGPEDELWCKEWWSNTLRFKNEEDKVRFILKWL